MELRISPAVLRDDVIDDLREVHGRALWANRRAVAAPTPEPAPVIKQLLPARASMELNVHRRDVESAKGSLWDQKTFRCELELPLSTFPGRRMEFDVLSRGV